MPPAGRALARALPLEATLAPILAGQRGVLAGADPADYPRAPVEIVLVSLTLIAQLGVELGRSCSSGGSAAVGGGNADRRERRRDAEGAGRLRRFLGEQAGAGEVKLCLGHAACRAESKDLARRASALISLLQVRWVIRCNLVVFGRAAAGLIGVLFGEVGKVLRVGRGGGVAC